MISIYRRPWISAEPQSHDGQHRLKTAVTAISGIALVSVPRVHFSAQTHAISIAVSWFDFRGGRLKPVSSPGERRLQWRMYRQRGVIQHGTSAREGAVRTAPE